MTTEIIALDRRIAQAMALQSKGADGAQELIDRLFAKRDELLAAA